MNMADDWLFGAAGTPDRFSGRGPKQEKFDLAIERSKEPLKSFVAEQNKSLEKVDSEQEIKIGPLAARRVQAPGLLRVTIDAGDRKFVFTATPSDIADAMIRTVRIFPENPYTPEKKQQADAAQNDPQKLKDIVPNFPDVWARIGTADAWARAVKLDPDNGDYRFSFAKILLDLQRLPEAEKEAAKAGELLPNSEPAWTTYGYVLILEKNYKKAREALRRALAIDPKSPIANQDMGVIAEAEGNMAEAAEWYRKAVQLDPNNAEARSGWNRCSKR
jgi:tetratricopeptide (TPR) repeat protein